MTRRGQWGVAAAIALVATIGFFVLTHYLGDELSPLGTGAQAPDFHAMTLDTPARAKSLADYKGQVVLLNLWATWCAPCRAEMPSMERLQQAYGSKGLKIVAVSIDDEGMEPAIRAFAKDYGLTFELLHDPTNATQRAYQTTGVPESVLIGKDGVIRNKISGATDWSSESIQNVVRALLAE